MMLNATHINCKSRGHHLGAAAEFTLQALMAVEIG